MALVDFGVSFTRGAALRLHKRLRIDEDYPWESLDASRYPPLLVARARRGWTENAFNEYCTFAVMGELLQSLALARAPLDLWTMACDFPREEALHVELCARVAERLGGLHPLRFDPDHVRVQFDQSLTLSCTSLLNRVLSFTWLPVETMVWSTWIPAPAQFATVLCCTVVFLITVFPK